MSIAIISYSLNLNRDTNWNLTAELVGQGFSGPPSLTVDRNSTGHYVLQFLPLWMCESIGKLSLFNQNTKETYLYTLRGEGQEPLAVDHVGATGPKVVLNISCFHLRVPTNSG